jgi:hypothetical protein
MQTPTPPHGLPAGARTGSGTGPVPGVPVPGVPQGVMGWQIADLVAAGILDAVPGDPPIPISVWRAAGPTDLPETPASVFARLTPRLAAILLAVYTDVGDTLIDTTRSPVLEGAAGASGRRYLALDLPSQNPDEHQHLEGKAGLILLRWPPTGPFQAPSGTSHPGDDGMPDPHPVLHACRDLLSTHGHTMVFLAPPVGTYRDHARSLIPAAAAVGLGYLQHIVVVTAIDPPPTSQPPTATPPRMLAREHLDLLVFILRPRAIRGGRS